MTRALRPTYLEELGLVAALEMLAREIEQPQSLVVDFQLIGKEKRLGAEVELALFRIVQEALNNVVKHAQASQVSLCVSFTPETVTLEVRDNGIGFDPDKAEAIFLPFKKLHGQEYDGTGIGLTIVRRIIHRHGGSIRAEYDPETGTTLYFTL